MPPKFKFTKEELIGTALDLVRVHGFSFLTARSLAKELGSSTKVIFGQFQTMDEFHEEILRAIRNCYNQRIQCAMRESLPFRSVGVAYIQFAIEEPEFFKILFMSQQDLSNVEEILPIIDENYEIILSSVKSEYDLTNQQANKLYRHIWIYSHGIATLSASRLYRFTPEEIEQQLSEVFKSLLVAVKEKKL